MVANIKTDELDLTADSARELHAEIRYLRHELQLMADRLAVEQAKGRSRKKSKRTSSNIGQTAGNIYVFDEDDAERAAFDEFFSAEDPHLEKVRRFLLD